MRVIVVGRSPEKMDAAIAVLESHGFAAIGVFSEPEAARAISEQDELFAVVAGGSIDELAQERLRAAAEPKGAVLITAYNRASGLAESADRSHGDTGIRYLDLPPTGETVTVGAVCRPGDEPDEAVLTMTLDGREVLSVRGDKGRPDGQVGMFDWGAQQTDRPLVTDFTNFAASGSLR
jgi:hypothetical protein